jgi:hypothetical protein
MAYPGAGTFDVPATPGDFTCTQAAAAFEDWLAKDKTLPGATASVELVIASKVIIPTQARHTVDTEDGAAADDVETIQTTSMEDGAILVLSSESADRVVTIVDSAGGVGEIQTVDGEDYVLDAVTKCITLELRGTVWQEIARTYDYEMEDAQNAQIVDHAWFIMSMIGGQQSGVYVYSPEGLDSLKVLPTASAESMQISVNKGAGIFEGLPFTYQPTTPVYTTLIAPVSKDRIDTVSIDPDTRAYVVTQGVEADVPLAPATPTGNLKLAEIYHAVGETAIYAASNSGQGYITDSRVYLNA